MRHSRYRLAAALVALFGFVAVAHAEQDRVARVQVLRDIVEKQLRSFEESIAKGSAHPEVRAFTSNARNALVLGHDPKEAESLIQKAWDNQDMDPASPAFGTVAWQINNAQIKDPNAIEFTVHPLSAVFLQFAEKLSPQFRADAIPHLKAAIAAIRRHRVGLDYTNIYLMKMANLHLIGQYLGDAALTDEGAKGLRAWFAFTRENGITEFDSPTYANVQIGILGEVQRLTKDPVLAKQLSAALDYFWTDLAGNTFLPKGQLAGPFSRTYDFIAGDGTLDCNLYLEGLRDAPASAGGAAEAVINELEAGYRPSAETLALAKLPERLIHQKFGGKPGYDRTAYITPDFTIGSASAYYGLQDRQLSISLAAPNEKDFADLSVILDAYDNPYGDHKVLDRTGHAKPTHLKNGSATVQDKNRVLSILDLGRGIADNPVASVATNVLFPSDADEILLDGKDITLSPGETVAASAESWLIVREGHSAAAVRVFFAEAAADQKTEWMIKNDGERFHAARLIAYQFHSANAELTQLSEKHLCAGIALIAQPCADSAAAHEWAEKLKSAELTTTRAEGRLSAKFLLEGDSLAATLDLKTGTPVSREIDGKVFVPAVFELNSEDKTRLLPGNGAP